MQEIKNNSQNPVSESYLFIPDQLIAGDAKLVTETVMFAGGNGVINRGALVGVSTGGKYELSSVSIKPSAILSSDIDTTSGDVNGGVYLMGEFNENAVNLNGLGLSEAKSELRKVSIFLKPSVSAKEPQ